MKYKLSKFTDIININNDELIVYNTYNGNQCYVFDKNLINQFRNLLNNEMMNEHDIDERIIEKFCVPVHENEDEKVNKKIDEIIFNNDLLSLIIFPTLECNFKCKYCYEKKEKGFMTDELYDKLYSSIVHHFKNNRFKYLKLDWFGGEPLLCINKMEQFTQRVNSFCDKNDIIYQHGITTNGYLLNPENIQRLLSLKIRLFQITIDGMPKTHDLYRPTINGKKTWETIIQNLKYMHTLKEKFTVVIRVNYNLEILETIEELLTFISNNFSNDLRFRIAFKTIGHWGSENDLNVSTIDYEYIPFFTIELLKMCKDLNLISQANFNLECGSELCYAHKRNSLVVYKNGNLGKCTLEENPDSSSDFVVGNILDGYFNLNEDKMKLWCNRNLDIISENCSDCKAYPFCAGSSCPALRVRKGKDCISCTPTKDIIAKLVELNYLPNQKGV